MAEQLFCGPPHIFSDKSILSTDVEHFVLGSFSAMSHWNLSSKWHGDPTLVFLWAGRRGSCGQLIPTTMHAHTIQEATVGVLLAGCGEIPWSVYGE